VTLLRDNFYARWRSHRRGVSGLREESEVPPERLLQAVWQHQRLRRTHLKTLDDRPVRVLHPGFASTEGGPDFRDAVIQIGDGTPRSGAVEVDLHTGGWHAHGHDRNPNFQNVILHVVWDGDPRPEAPPALSLRGVLDAPLAELAAWADHEPPGELPAALRGKCSSPLRELPEDPLLELLREAAHVRLQAKARQFETRARDAGWEQALWEGLLRGLGYKHNSWPMQTLAEARSRWFRAGEPILHLQARLLGLSGLLPAELPRAQTGRTDYLRRVWDCWWRDRDEFADCALPRAVWRLHGLRPANHPQRRLATVAHWLLADNLPGRLETWCAAEIADDRLADSLVKLFQVTRDEFWSWHWTLRSPRLSRPQPLPGATRVTDLAINVVLPWLWIRAAHGRNVALQLRVARRYFAWPAGEDNSVLRAARQRLLGGRRLRLREAAVQQGLLQVINDFCRHTNALCDDCRFPELVKAWNQGPGGASAAR
jgi:hypothetical protein